MNRRGLDFPVASAAPPAPPRPTVVVRAGPPPPSGRLDAVLGAVGVLLLLSTVGLAVALPQKDVLPQQFKVTWVDEVRDLTQQTFAFRVGGANATHDFLYEIPDDNVALIAVQYGFADDLAASAPDQFSLRLYDPHGNQVGPEVVAINAPGSQVDPVAPPQPLPAGSLAAEYRAVRFDGQFTVALPRPADDIVEVADPTVDAAALGRQLEAQAHLDTHGTWKLRVALLAAGGCPPAANQDAANRFAACRQEMTDAGASAEEAARGADPGNPFTVGVFSYSRFAPDIQKIG